MNGARFGILWRTFAAQCLAGETAAIDDRLRATLAGVVAFLLVPGLVLLVDLSFDYQGIVLRAIHYQQFDHLTDTLEWVALVFITYSAAAVGLVGAFAWDALVFDRRDGLVLGPLPVSIREIVAAKTAAVASVMASSALAVNLFNALVFAFTTADRLGLAALGRHFVAHLAATTGVAMFVFATLVFVRGVVGLIVSPRLAAAIGTAVQFVFVLAVFAIVILCPVMLRLPHQELVNFTVTHALPTSWFLGVFEWIRGSSRWYVPQLALRAVLGTAAAFASAILASTLAVHRHMPRAFATPHAEGAQGGAPVRRWIALRLTAGDRSAAAIADFIVLTFVRNRAVQTPAAMIVALGLAIVVAALAQTKNVASEAGSGIVVLWIPLVVAYSALVGLRASFFVPADLDAVWAFRLGVPRLDDARWCAVRAALMAMVAPVVLAISLVTTAYLLGWWIAVRHTMFVAAIVVVMVEATAMTVPFVPFTRPYQPGRARLRTRWWMYVVGLCASAVWPVWFELRAASHPRALAAAIVVLAAAAAAMEIAGRHQLRPSAEHSDDIADERDTFAVLDIGMAVQGASR